MVCSAPSSVTVKSFAVNPSTTLSLLSFTFTASTTNWLLVENVDGLAPPAGAFWPICCARRPSATRKRAATARCILTSSESHDKSRGQTSHVVGRGWKTELRIAERGVPDRKGWVVGGVCVLQR